MDGNKREMSCLGEGGGEGALSLFCIHSSMRDHDATVQRFCGDLPQIWLLVRPLKHSLPEIGASDELGRSDGSTTSEDFLGTSKPPELWQSTDV